MYTDTSPFSFNDLVTDELFIGREEQLDDLIKNISAHHDTTLYGQRKVGKSSLIQEAIRVYHKKHKKHLFLKLDLSQCTSTQEFISILCSKISDLTQRTKPLKHKIYEIGNFITSIKPIISIDPITGKFEQSFDFAGTKREVDKTLDDVFDLLGSIAKEFALTMIIDEFQSITFFSDSDKLQWKLRSRIQEQNNIGFIFLGSSTRLISEIFIDSKSAFYKSTDLIYLENRLKPALVFPWIRKQFLKAKIKISDEIIKEITDITRFHPYYTQKFCYNLWRDNFIEGSRKITELTGDIFRQSLKKIINKEKLIFQERFDRLSANQRAILKALAKLEPGESITGKEARLRFDLSTRAAIAKSLKSMEKEISPLIYKSEESGYIIEDPFFELWLKS